MTEEGGIKNLKVIVVGSYSIGKTALVNRFQSNYFTENYQETIQAEMKTIPLTNESTQEKVILNVWDTAGQERFGSLAPLLYKNTQVSLICFDFEDELSKNKINDFIDAVRNVCTDCVFYLVATRIDKHKNDDEIQDFLQEKETEIKEKYPDLILYPFLTSAKSGEGITNLFQHVANSNISANIIQEDQRYDIDISKPEIEEKKKCC